MTNDHPPPDTLKILEVLEPFVDFCECQMRFGANDFAHRHDPPRGHGLHDNLVRRDYKISVFKKRIGITWDKSLCFQAVIQSQWRCSVRPLPPSKEGESYEKRLEKSCTPSLHRRSSLVRSLGLSSLCRRQAIHRRDFSTPVSRQTLCWYYHQGPYDAGVGLFSAGDQLAQRI